MSAPIFEHGTESANDDQVYFAKFATSVLHQHLDEDLRHVRRIITNPPDEQDADLEEHCALLFSHAREIERRELEGEKSK